jgi:Fe-S oxidoreductase
MALLKTELIHARQQRYGASLASCLLSSVDFLGKIGSTAAPVANFLLNMGPVRWLLEKMTGISARRPLPQYASVRFDHWFYRRRRNLKNISSKGSIILWDDTFVRYHEPQIGKAATLLLEALGYEVKLAKGHGCCGRPAFSVGRLDKAYNLGFHNTQLLHSMGGTDLILFLEPSCFSMFTEDYLELQIPFAKEMAQRAVLLESFLLQAMEQSTASLQFGKQDDPVAIHVHCHAKKDSDAAFWKRLLSHVCNGQIFYLSTGCCGMAGAFGMFQSRYDLSLAIAKPMVSQIHSLPENTRIIACGTSCRQQIQHLTGRTPYHIAEIFADALAIEVTT